MLVQPVAFFILLFQYSSSQQVGILQEYFIFSFYLLLFHVPIRATMIQAK